MKNNKALLFISVLILAMLVAGCSINTEANTKSPNVETSENQETVRGTVSTETPTDTQSGESEEDYSEKIGTINGSVYENSYFGYGCSFNDSWTFYNDEELAELVGITADSMENDVMAEYLKNSGSTYDMYAYADDGIVTVNVTIENLGVLYGAALDESSYAELALDNAIDALNSIDGVEVVESNIQDMEFAGGTHTSIKFLSSYTVEGVDVNLYQLLICVKSGNYMSVITFTTFFEDITETLAAEFYGL